MSAVPAPVPMGPCVVACSIPKLGRDDAENEDSVRFDTLTGRYAVADGASTSARAEVWSGLLVQSFVQDRVNPLEPVVLVALREQWHTLVTQGRQLPWYAVAKLQHGADSTFVGLHLDYAGRVYDATIVGDSCLFHLRRHQLLFAGPAGHPDDFGRFPQLISTRHDAEPLTPAVFTGDYRSGDVFVLATDAVARFLLDVYVKYGRMSSVVELGQDQYHFVRKVAKLRQRGLMANDDATICLVRV